MLDVAPTEFLLVAFVALVVIGPKDLPKAMRVLGYWVGRVRSVGRQFRAGFDEMVREAELEEMEKKWAAENARIMREHPAPATPALPAADSAGAPAIAVSAADHAGPPEALPPPSASDAVDRDPAQPSLAFDDPAPQMVERPVVEPAGGPDEVDADDRRRDDERRDRAPS